MAFQVSPGVNVSEIDLTTIVPTSSTTNGGFVGVFQWGPVLEVNLVEDELQLVREYGKPTDNNFVSFFTASNFLAYGNKLRLVRVVGTGALNATSETGTGSGTPGTGLLIPNEDNYQTNFVNGAADVGPVSAKYPGEVGNSLKISICPSASAFSKDVTGTVDTDGSGNLIGTGTLFLSELEVGSIIIAPTGEQASITSIIDDENATIDSDFNANLVNASVKAKWEYSNLIQFQLGTSDHVANRGGSLDEMHVVIVDEDGKFTGVAGQVLESFPLISKASDAKKEDGSSNYYKSVLNRQSAFVWWTDHIPSGTNWGQDSTGTTFVSSSRPHTFSLSGGVNGADITDGQKILGYDKFIDAESVDVSMIIGGESSATVATSIINNVCEVRGDCIAVLSPERDDVVANSGNEVDDILDFRNNLPSSSYAILDSGWKYQYDKYNDEFRWIPLNGDIAGLMVRTDTERDPWFSPAGFNRGNIKNVTKLAFSPTQGQRDDLYQSSINPVVSFQGQGTILYGDKTLLSRPSAFDRINVRRLFIVLRKSISRAARFSLFEFNDEATRAQFKSLVEPFLREIQSRRGITDFHVVCDSRNNTPDLIDRNEFVGDIYIKPARSINFIQLNFIAVRTGVEFNEIIGQI